MSSGLAKNRTIGYRSEVFDTSLVHFCVVIDLQPIETDREIS